MSEATKPNSKARFHILDGARFIAALSVLFYHYFAAGPESTIKLGKQLVPTHEFPELYPALKFGFLGVNLFFLISGFVIFASAINRTPIQFAVLRWIRLFPTYWFAMLFTTIAVYLYDSEKFNITLFQFLANLTMLNDYMSIKDIDPVYWTLHVELQFYACIFMLLLIGAFKHYRVWLTTWIILCILYEVISQPFFLSWFISPKYSSLFISGIVFYLARMHGYDLFLRAALFFSYGLSLYFTPDQVDLYTTETTLQDKITGMLIVTSFYIFFFLISIGKLNINRNQILLVLGGLTYPLYLIHLIAGRRLMDAYFGAANNYVIVSITMVIMLLCALIIHLLIDKKACGMLRSKILSLSFIRKQTK